MELSVKTLGNLPATVVMSDYDRSAVRPGIAHLSVGNFHRAHQAVYVDRVLALPEQGGWGIVGVGLLDTPAEAAKAAALQAQDGLYTLTECPADKPDVVRVIKSLVEYVHAPADRAAAIRRLADPAIRVVTMTITEGGYYMDEAGQFMHSHPDMVEDLARQVPHSAFGVMAEALRLRREAGVVPFTVLSCDNVPHNGHVARKALVGWAEQRDKDLAGWISQNVAFPSCMVDRITPAVREADIQRLDAASGIEDRAPVYCEDFIQWVVEDTFPSGRPDWEKVGVLFTQDVAPYEQVKLRMLNATHSMMALPGVLMGYRVVSDAMQDASLYALLQQFLGFDAEPLLQAPPGMALQEYGALLLSRFRNKAISDQLVRIASDSASKLPVFIRPTASGVVAQGRDARRIAFLLACFCAYLAGRDEKGAAYDVLEPHLTDEDKKLAFDADPAKALEMSVFSGWDLEKSDAFVTQFVEMRQALKAQGVRKTLETGVLA